jgi:hypothetical protein
MTELAEALSLAALIAATLEYAILIGRRERRRAALQWQQTVRESLLSGGLVSERRWRKDGDRYVLAR